MLRIKERQELLLKLKNVMFRLNKKNYVIKKDGNKLGRKKYRVYLDMYNRYHYLKMDTNSVYGTSGTSVGYPINKPNICQILNSDFKEMFYGTC